MVSKIMKSNSLVLAYELLSDDGKLSNKSQKFDMIQLDSTAEDLHEIGTSIETILASSLKEIKQNSVFLIVEE